MVRSTSCCVVLQEESNNLASQENHSDEENIFDIQEYLQHLCSYEENVWQ